MFPTTEYENISIQITSRRSIIQLSYENYATRVTIVHTLMRDYIYQQRANECLSGYVIIEKLFCTTVHFIRNTHLCAMFIQ